MQNQLFQIELSPPGSSETTEEGRLGLPIRSSLVPLLGEVLWLGTSTLHGSREGYLEDHGT